MDRKKNNRMKPVLPMLLALATGWAWQLLSPLAIQAQSTAIPFYDLPIFVDSKGDTVWNTPDRLPFKIIEGFPEYKIGPGDILEVITVEGTDRRTERVRVQPDGTVSFSILTAIPVRNLTLSEITQKLREQLELYIHSPQIQVFIQNYNSRKASVFGAINLNVGSNVGGSRIGPGIYALEGYRTALELIMQAGGPAPDARLDQARLTRENKTYLLDLQKAVTIGDTRQNVILQDGDVLQITGTQQSDRRVAILGAVSEPGIANLSNQSTMLEAISAANGFTEQAASNRIRIIRTNLDRNNPEIITVNAQRILKGDLSQNIFLLDGDIVVVPQAYMYDLSEMLTEISPLINFGGLLSTGPAVALSGYNWNLQNSEQSAAGLTNTGVSETLSTSLLPQNTSRNAEAEKRILEQIQKNLQKETQR